MSKNINAEKGTSDKRAKCEKLVADVQNKKIRFDLGDKKNEDLQVKFEEDIVRDIRQDFENRAAERRAFEAQWQLNSNFVMGNQYCVSTVSGGVEDIGRDYYWQEREVFNHIAPLIDTRLAKLNRVRPKMSVRPASGDENDVKTAKLATKVLESTMAKLDLDARLSTATYWSELTGTAFYKITWDEKGGRCVGKLKGKEVYEGEVRVDVCPPYEVFPNSLSDNSIEDTQSIIHARAVNIDEIERVYGVRVKPESLEVISLANSGIAGGAGLSSVVPALSRQIRINSCLVIERYTRPTPQNSEGEFCVVAGNKLLYHGSLPYINDEDGRRGLPFVKQEALSGGGRFFGISIIERTIPIQRAYNSVKNRKHEFMNRIAMGVLAVEEGSVDTESLAEEGLCPGKILVYRQGSNPPRLLDPGRVPSDFGQEEDRLLNEFIAVSGVSEIMRSSSVPSSLSSGTALQLLIEQDDTRLAVTAELIRNAIKQVAKHILRLYKQFASQMRLSRIAGDDGQIELLCWDASDIGCDDIVFDTENELNSTPAAKRNMMFELLKMGLLHDEQGKLSDGMRYKILDVLGYGGWEITRDIATLHINRAEKENIQLAKEQPKVLEIDEHNTHINIHTKFILSEEFDMLRKKRSSLEETLLEHIRTHKQFISLEKQALLVEGEVNG